MRYTVENTVAIGRPLKVFVDGVEVDEVIMADTEKGEVLYYPKPVRVSTSNPEEIHAEVLRGHVTVKGVKKWPL